LPVTLFRYIRILTCLADYINTHKVTQDHPCVLDIIRHKFMNPPVPRDVPYELEDVKVRPEFKTVNDTEIKHLLKKKVGSNHFFILYMSIYAGCCIRYYISMYSITHTYVYIYI